MSTPASTRAPTAAPTWLIWVALGTVYVIWSTTYLGIRITNETLPPLIAAGTRFVIAGSVLLAVTIRRGDVRGDPVGRTQWWAAFVVGRAADRRRQRLRGPRRADDPERDGRADLRARPALDRPVGTGSSATAGSRSASRSAWSSGFAGAALLVGDARVGGLPLSGLLLAVAASMSWAGGVARRAQRPRSRIVRSSATRW